MIPNASILTETLTERTHGSKTYLTAVAGSNQGETGGYRNRIKGCTDGLESIKQAIYMILSTERYKFPIYSWDYGVELQSLYGKPMSYVMAELPRRIKDALLVDDRIRDVGGFAFQKTGSRLQATFTVLTTAGAVTTGLEVEV